MSQQDTDRAPPQTYRISELAAASGVSRDMIKYYLRANLLPKARKPRPNLSLYSDTHLRLIDLILQFQAKTRLSLQEIGDLFQQAGYDPGTIEMELLADRHVGGGDNIIPFDGNTTERIALPCPADFVDALLEAGLIDGPLPLDEHREKLAGLLWASREQGVPLGFFTAARSQLLELADLEVKSLIGIKRPGLDYNAVLESVSGADQLIN
ncbi:MAG: MerR family transcriptional regulator, partial [Halioglobus sp.]|nr:MerR family transcriptional regulator [Halioglobus sp.]